MGLFDFFKKKGTVESQKSGVNVSPDWKNPDLEIARSAVSKISDQDLLIRIIKEKNYSVEHEAQVRLLEIISPDTKQETLFEIADSFGYIPLRIKATELLEDQTLLTKIANKQIFMGEKINETAKKKLSKLTHSYSISRNIHTIENRRECKVGSNIILGKWDEIPLTWKIIAEEDGRLLLLCNDLLGNRAYHDGETATWDISQLRKDLNGDWFYSNPKVFSYTEREIITPVTNDSPGIYYQNQTTWEECYADKGQSVEDYVFLLSCQEAMKLFNGTTVIWKKSCTNNKFEFFSSHDLIAPHPWWLRNATRRNSAAVVVTVDGIINDDGFSINNNNVPEVRPALWITKGSSE